ncbi:MDR family MFS transporter [Alicyclobacillus macrosporangiidus]|uniref:Drug resistance transporter, EmrB/QacA subfamily n=1 Tax=Alicyclobacillus macrosporangiidus TaxID=392015 RepID=A0A1I7HCQ0_9BACL|nr:MDR family MFS transporter [Alicyclobacillus macrosporangiidus]SFU58495.1 drug resistance transporter, EmrB/QacA subfamily [Alicyclobacillus macrosporangiidus]
MNQTQIADTHVAETERLGVMVQIGLLAGPFMSMLDSSVVNVALPDMAKALHSSLATVQWVASAYLLALGMALTGTAYLAKRFGTKQIYLLSLIGFTVSSVLCAVAPSIWTLIGARVVQGVFGAPLVPLAMNMLLGKGSVGNQMSAAAGLILFLAPAVGPSLGGVLVHVAGWSTIFLVNVPVGILAIMGIQRLPGTFAHQESGKAHFDAPGFILLSIGLAGLSYGASKGPQSGWFFSSVWPYWTVGVMLIAAYAVWASRREDPMIDMTLLQKPQQVLALTLAALVSVVTFAVVLLVPAFMQEIQGRSEVVAGMTLLPQGLITGIGAVLGNRLPSRWGVRRTVVFGMVLLTLSTVGLLTVTATTPPLLMALILCGRGFAIGLVIQPLLNGIIKSLPEAKVPDGNTLFNVVERICGTLGIALIVTLYQVREHVRIQQALGSMVVPDSLVRQSPPIDGSRFPVSVQHHLADAATSGFHDVIWLVAGMSALGVVLALILRNESPSTHETRSSSGPG